ncbi:MAG: error-prone polymerase [Actinomycetota bacterium]|nr:error-prone polymerase [Actinomycetota bacterium]
MGFNNPDVPWRELERQLSGRPKPASSPDYKPDGGDGGDSPAWSRKRPRYEPAQLPPQLPGQPSYAELHCHSNFSFLDGASEPEELAEEAARLGLEALAITDHDGFYGVVRFAEAAGELGVRTVFGAELSLALPTPQNGIADPEGDHLLVLARDPEGYRRLAMAISDAQLAGKEKGRPIYDVGKLAQAHDGHWLILTGCRKGSVPRTLAAEGLSAAEAELDRLIDMFGRDSVLVELTDHANPLDSARNDALFDIAGRRQVGAVATTNAHYATPNRGRLAAALAAVRGRRGLDDMDGWLPAAGTAHLRSGAEMAARFARYPGVVELAAEVGLTCAFDLRLVAPRLPDFPVPPGHSEMSYLRELTMRGALEKYGPPEAERQPGAYKQLEHELDIVEKLDFPGYFLIVWEIVEFCRTSDILCQGRGSAANSAVCYALGITKADPIYFKLLFERFLAPERDGPPDIDLDIESGRREEAIQHVYQRYGRTRTAQVANVISYRPKSAVRDMAKALGYSTGQQDAWSKQIDRWASVAADQNGTGSGTDHDIPADVVELAEQVLGFPRHLGIHSGGMVICDRPVTEVCPVEWGRMENRTVLQWDKDDCARTGLVKFDLLGLGMLSALHGAFDLLREHYGLDLQLDTIPPEDPKVYDMLCAADSVGVFQVESRAQMATLPRLKPRTFYDLVTEVAIIRPGPIQGGSVHPYIRRRNGLEESTYAHPLLKKSLERTYGVPLFQEQVMQMAIDVAGLTASESDQLRQAMSSKRSTQRMERLRGKLYSGMAERGITGAVADEIYEKLTAFAHFGFPESHSISFAYLVYASSWLKLHYPAAFCAALLNAQPMGFYSPQSLVADARRHGVEVRRPDINASAALATLEAVTSRERVEFAVRLGLTSVRSIGEALAERIAAERPYTGMADLVHHIGLTTAQVEALATAGAFDCFGLSRREALWAAGAAAQATPGRLEGTVLGAKAPALPLMSDVERTVADLWATAITTDGYPTRHVRDRLDDLGVLTAAALRTAEPGRRVLVGGVVTHWQRPATAGGTTFLNLEDETGMVNVICSRGVWTHHRRIARTAAALLVWGRLEREQGVVNVVAERLDRLPLSVRKSSRDFQ